MTFRSHALARAMTTYDSVQVRSQVDTASKGELAALLIDGALDSLVQARGHLQHRAHEPKALAIARASRILYGLQSALDPETAGDLAQQLYDLYGFALRRLVQVNATDDAQMLDQVILLVQSIAMAWTSVTRRH